MGAASTIFRYSHEQRKSCLDPLVDLILSSHRRGETTVVGVQGGQGTGKTTLAAYLADRLTGAGFRVVSFSIDDFYTSLAHRKSLAGQYPGNPFYQLPRGMPGTHRTDALHSTLLRLKDGVDVDIPVFDKSAHQGQGDIAGQVVPVRGRKDFVIFEGWCVGVPDCSLGELEEICRGYGMEVDAGFDRLGAVLENLGPYQRLWRLMDLFVMLYPDSLAFHERWRLEQEHKLIADRGSGMPDGQVRELVRRFLPLTCLCYAKATPDVKVRIDGEHRLYGLEWRGKDGAHKI